MVSRTESVVVLALRFCLIHGTVRVFQHGIGILTIVGEYTYADTAADGDLPIPSGIG